MSLAMVTFDSGRVSCVMSGCVPNKVYPSGMFAEFGFRWNTATDWAPKTTMMKPLTFKKEGISRITKFSQSSSSMSPGMSMVTI